MTIYLSVMQKHTYAHDIFFIGVHCIVRVLVSPVVLIDHFVRKVKFHCLSFKLFSCLSKCFSSLLFSLLTSFSFFSKCSLNELVVHLKSDVQC